MKSLSYEFKLVGGFAIGLAMLLIAGSQLFLSIQEYRQTSKWVAHTYQVIDSLGDVRSALSDRDASIWKHVITDNNFSQDEHQVEENRILATVDQLKEFTNDNSGQQSRIVVLFPLVRQRLQMQDRIVAVFHNEGFSAARALIASSINSPSQETMSSQISAMENEEKKLLKQRNEQAENNANQTNAVGAVLVVFALVGLGLLWWRMRHEAAKKQASQAAIHESVMLKQILDLLPVGMFVTDIDGNVKQSNPAAREIWKGTSLVNSDYSGWLTETGKPLAEKDWGLNRALKNSETIRDQLVDIRCFDGSRKTIAYHAMPIHDTHRAVVGGLVVNVDVTDLKRTERRLRATARFDETQGRALALFSSSFNRIKILEGLLTLLADEHPFPVSALYVFDEWSGGYRCDAAHGLDGTVPRQFKLGEGLLGQAAQAGKMTMLDCSVLTLQTGLAEFAPMQVMMIPVVYQERRLAVLVLAASRKIDDGYQAFLERLAITLGVALDNLRQYSDLQMLAEKLRASSEDISVKNLQLEDASRMKSEFLANMSHELRTPLNAIMGFSEVLRDGLLGELTTQQKEYVSDIFNSGTHLLSLINDILDLSKVEAGKMTLELEPMNMQNLIDSGLQIVREKALSRNISLTMNVVDNLDEIWIDERKTKQILYNLLSNSVKFTPDGGVVTVAVHRVACPPACDKLFEHYLELTVTDTGIGISVADQARLFQPFVQIDSTLARRFEGTGLGLAMVKRLAELHGGKVEVHSVTGMGSTFTVWLPWRIKKPTITEVAAIAPISVGLPVIKAIAQPLVSATNGELPVVLIVEDDSKAALLLQLQLESAGFRVIFATTGESALEMAMQESPDLITLDIMLPGMNGWEFLERAKKLPQVAKIPILIVSIVADRIRGMALGAAQVLQKPVGRDELVRALALVGFPVASKGERHTILLVDDDPKAVQLLGVYLDPSDYQVFTAYGGAEAIEVARRQHLDLIVLDLMMPEVNGFDVVDALKREELTAIIPIIIVTAKQMTVEDRARLNGDIDLVLEKSELNHGRFINEVRAAMAGDKK